MGSKKVRKGTVGDRLTGGEIKREQGLRERDNHENGRNEKGVFDKKSLV